MNKRISSLAIFIGLVAACAFGGETESQTGSVQGVVFTSDADGGRSVVPGTKVFLDGPDARETEADAAGKYMFNALPPGSYNLKAQAPHMTATQMVVVTAGAPMEGVLGGEKKTGLGVRKRNPDPTNGGKEREGGKQNGGRTKGQEKTQPAPRVRKMSSL